MQFRKGVAVGYATQLYVTVIGIVFVPSYVQLIGAESFGLVGFFTVLQTWFTLLDIGLSATISRETARYRGGGVGETEYLGVVKALSVIFWAIAVMGSGGLWLTSERIFESWIVVSDLTRGDVVFVLELMSITIGLRWVSSLYRGLLLGFEKIGLVNLLAGATASGRFIGVLFSLELFGSNVRVFFVHQLVVAALEASAHIYFSHRYLPRSDTSGPKLEWRFVSVLPTLRFSLTMAVASALGTMATQTDKLLLSGLLPLEDYGHFTLAVMVAGGIMLVSGPLSSTLMPLLARLHARGKNGQLRFRYIESTAITTSMSASAAFTLVFFADSFLYAWTGDLQLAMETSLVLKLYGCGYALLTIVAFPFYLQYAIGELRAHLIYTSITTFAMIPLILFAGSRFGAVGAGGVWVLFQIIGLVFWAGYVHRRHIRGYHWVWFKDGVVRPAFASAIVGCMWYVFVRDPLDERLISGTYVVLTAVTATSVSIFYSGRNAKARLRVCSRGN